MALGRDLRVVGQHDGRRRAPCRRSSVASTGKMFDVLARRDRRGGVGPGATGEAKRPPGARATRCVESSEARSALAAVQALGDLRRVVHAHRDAHEAAVERRRGQARAALDGVERELVPVADRLVSGTARARSAATPWRSPLGSRKATRPPTDASCAAARARAASARGRTCAARRPRRPAGRRCRTASASRSSSRPACTGRARSPRRAGWTSRRSTLTAGPARCRRTSAARARPCARASAVERLRAGGGPSRRRGSARRSSRFQTSTGICQRAEQLHGTSTTCSRSSVAAVEHGAVEVEAQRDVAVAQRRRSTWPTRPRGRRCTAPRP